MIIFILIFNFVSYTFLYSKSQKNLKNKKANREFIKYVDINSNFILLPSKISFPKNFYKINTYLFLDSIGCPVPKSVIILNTKLDKKDIHNIRRYLNGKFCSIRYQYKIPYIKPIRGGKKTLIDIKNFKRLWREEYLLWPVEHIDRIKNLYGFNVLYTPSDKKITIELVGKGFDGTDLNKGDLSPHQIIVLHLLYDKLEDNNWYKFKNDIIEKKNYQKTIQIRTNKLLNLGINKYDIVIPSSYTPLSEKFLKKINFYSNKLFKKFNYRKEINISGTITEDERIIFWDFQTPEDKSSQYIKKKYIKTGLLKFKELDSKIKSKQITIKDALLQINKQDLDEILINNNQDQLDRLKILTTGIGASKGISSAPIVFSIDKANQMYKKNKKYILFTEQTNADDISGIKNSSGVLTLRGGISCHAAIVSRGIMKPCIIGLKNSKIHFKEKIAYINGIKIKEGEILTIDGDSGKVYIGKISQIIKDQTLPQCFYKWIQSIKNLKKIKIYSNSTTLSDIKLAEKLGNEGIGLCRTENMFYQKNNLYTLQKLILTKDKEKKQKELLNELMNNQEQDFLEIFKNIKNNEITIRLLDPPLHEFLPKIDLKDQNFNKKISLLSMSIDTSKEKIIEKIKKLSETNPMLGCRGLRLNLIIPKLYEVQIEAILRAYKNIIDYKKDIKIKIMCPFVSFTKEVILFKNIYKKISNKVFGYINNKIKIGIMVEIPNIALNIDKIASEIDFISFGTNDLTQMLLGLSRDDSQGTINHYLKNNILKENPFEVLSENSIKKFIEDCVIKARLKNPSLEVSICGEQTCDTNSIDYFDKINLDYISCSASKISYMQLGLAKYYIKNHKLN